MSRFPGVRYIRWLPPIGLLLGRLQWFTIFIDLTGGGTRTHNAVPISMRTEGRRVPSSPRVQQKPRLIHNHGVTGEPNFASSPDQETHWQTPSLYLCNALMIVTFLPIPKGERFHGGSCHNSNQVNFVSEHFQ